MEKRVPKSEKYSHVQGKLDTGLTVDKVKYVTAREYRKRRDEIFFRISCGQLSDLFSEYEGDENENISDSFRGGDGSLKIVTHTDTAEASYNKPYLILDVRESDQFNAGHILQARTFPYALLRRDQLHPEVYKFKNKPETLIILYCDDEKVSCDAGKVMVDRGIDNIYVLNGGFNEFAVEFSSYIEGNLPALASSRNRTSTTIGRALTRLGKIPEDSSYVPSFGGSSHGNDFQLTPRKLSKHNSLLQSAPSSSRMMTSSSRMEKQSDAGVSTNSNISVAESVISKAASRKGRF